MNEARRFLRYVMPGLVFITETMLLLWIIIPDWTTDLLSNLKKGLRSWCYICNPSWIWRIRIPLQYYPP